MTEGPQDPWKLYLRDVKALSFPAKVEKKPQKLQRRSPNPLKSFLNNVSFENVSRETFLASPHSQALSRKKIRNATVERRFDLHGLTLKEAHRELSVFLWKASQQGLRTVLVITGKGRGSRPLEDGGNFRMTLKEVVPLWLQEPPLKSLVGSWSKASPEHGGEGALYIFLKSIS